MRIIGGSLRGRYIEPPLKKWPTRPTTDIAKEALYNILMNRIDFEEVKMLDLFGGTGIHCFEFLSRGCEQVTYVDNYGAAVRWVKQQAAAFDFSDLIHIQKKNVKSFIQHSEEQYDFIFADPPYDMAWLKELPEMIFDQSMVSEDGLLIIEHGSDTSFEKHPRFTEGRTYGQSKFSFFS